MTEKVIFAKDLVTSWLNKIKEKEYSITVHPKEENGFQFPERFLRSVTDSNKEWSEISQVEGKLVIKSKDPIKMASLIIQIEGMGYSVEE
ncbi:hypothetical protein EB001_07370 [bacterium]|nr:hypothetical protein [bacterium]